MIFPVTHHDWQILRTVLRAELAGDSPPLGRELRPYPSRKTKDGTFLDVLVANGLLAVARSGSADPGERLHLGQPEPVQFRTRFKLTDKGRHAAEYGEYEREHKPADLPLTGAVGHMHAEREAKRLTAPARPANARAEKKKFGKEKK